MQNFFATCRICYEQTLQSFIKFPIRLKYRYRVRRKLIWWVKLMEIQFVFSWFFFLRIDMNILRYLFIDLHSIRYILLRQLPNIFYCRCGTSNWRRMGVKASQINSNTFVYCSGYHYRIHQSSPYQPIVRRIHQWLVYSHEKWSMISSQNWWPVHYHKTDWLIDHLYFVISDKYKHAIKQ